MRDIDAEFIKTAVDLYYRETFADRDIASLQDAGYQIVDVNASEWDLAAMHRDLAHAFGFPDHY